MNQFIFWFIDKVYSVVDILRAYTFYVGGFPVTYFDLCCGALIISMVVGIAWKGAKG